VEANDRHTGRHTRIFIQYLKKIRCHGEGVERKVFEASSPEEYKAKQQLKTSHISQNFRHISALTVASGKTRRDATQLQASGKNNF